MGQLLENGPKFQQSAGGKSIDPRLVGILTTAAGLSGLDVQFVSGVAGRLAGTKNHIDGYAVDIQLVDPATGKALPNYQNAQSFRMYENFAQLARVIQSEQYPELDSTFRWGGYFSKGGSPFGYGAVDLMHFDITPSARGAMALGSWEHGASSALLKAYPGATTNGGMSGNARLVAQVKQQLAGGYTPPASIPEPPIPADATNVVQLRRQYANSNLAAPPANPRPALQAAIARLTAARAARAGTVVGAIRPVSPPLPAQSVTASLPALRPQEPAPAASVVGIAARSLSQAPAAPDVQPRTLSPINMGAALSPVGAGRSITAFEPSSSSIGRDVTNTKTGAAYLGNLGASITGVPVIKQGVPLPWPDSIPKTVMVPNPQYKVPLSGASLGAPDLMSITPYLDENGNVVDPLAPKKAAALPQQSSQPKMIPKTIYVPNPAPPPTYTGSATGQQYRIGQNYVAANRIYTMTDNGPKQVGKVDTTAQGKAMAQEAARAAPGNNTDVFGNDMSFMPTSVQESERWRTGY